MKKIVFIVLSVFLILACDSNTIDQDVTQKRLTVSDGPCLDEEQDEDTMNPNYPPPPPDGFPHMNRMDIHRDFRDNVISINSNYSKYVDYYYDLSDEVEYRDLSFSTKLKIWSLVLNLDKPILNALDHNFDGVLLNQELYDEILILANDLETYSQNNFMFDEFRADLSNALNKTKSEILND